MQKTILITGSTDGIGLETAKLFLSQSHRVLLHGRNPAKVQKIASDLSTESYIADLSSLNEVRDLARRVTETNNSLDILVNNAGVFKTSNPRTLDGLDIRFAVNTIAPYLLTNLLLPLFNAEGRIINLSSTAQSSVSLAALKGEQFNLDDMEAYSQSKLALTMWTKKLAHSVGTEGPTIIAVNPGSLLGSKMVQEGFGIDGGDLSIGADIISRAALAEEFSHATGKYYDNDSQGFSAPHPDILSVETCNEIVNTIEVLLSKLSSPLP